MAADMRAQSPTEPNNDTEPQSTETGKTMHFFIANIRS